MRSQRATGASVGPCSTRVMKITEKVMKMICSRAGNLAPDAIVSGSAKASTSESPPRNPAQAMNRTVRHGGIGS